MGLLNAAKDVVSGFLTALNSDWWVEVKTLEPDCIYYFGPFDLEKDAETACPGYLEDLTDEGAQGITATVKRCNPSALTIVNGIKH